MFRRSSFWMLSFALTVSLALASCAPAAVSTVQPSPSPLPPATATSQSAVLSTATLAAAVTPGPISLTDSLGRKVTLKSPAQRIISLAPSNTEILFALGAGARLIGRDDFSDYPAQATQVPSIGSLYPNVNAERIVALAPDLVLAAGVTTPNDVQHLAQLGLTVYAAGNAGTLDDIYRDIAAIGALVGAPDAATGVVTGMQARVQAVKAKTSGLIQHPIVFYEIDATDPAKPWTAGPGSFIDQLVTLAGGTNAGNIAKDKYAQLSLEQLVTQNPDLIVLGSATFGGQTPETVAARVGWQNIKAVKNHMVYTFDDNLVSRPGPRVVDGLEKLAQLIHPEVFK